MQQWGILDNERKLDPAIFPERWGPKGCEVQMVILDNDKNLSRVPTNSVPAVAVIRRGQVLFALTGCKGCVGGLLSFKVKVKLKV